MSHVKDDLTNYHPSNETQEALKSAVVTAVVGPSGVGKTTLMKYALHNDPQLHFVLTDVSRPQRSGEQDGVDYHFCQHAEMVKLAQAGAYVQVAVHPSGDLYATRPDSYSATENNIMAILAAEIPHFRQLPFHRIRTIFVVPPDFKTWQVRMDLRDFTSVQLNERLAEAKKSFRFGLQDESAEFVINDSLGQAESDFMKLLADDDPPDSRSVMQTRAREIIKIILDQLS